MPRSIKKGPFIDHHLLKKVLESTQSGSKKPIKTWSRRSMILPLHVHQEVQVHNGKTFHKIKVTQEMIGHKFGEFARTRKQAKHKTLKQKNIRGKK